METKENLMELLAKIQCVEVFVFHSYNYSSPSMYEFKYEGENKFVKAFAFISKTSGQPFIYITEKNGEWNYRREISAYEFAKLLGLEILSSGIKAFTATMFANANGWGKDAEATIADNTKEVYASFEDGERYWKNMVAQEADIAKAKADKAMFEEALAKWNASQATEDNSHLND